MGGVKALLQGPTAEVMRAATSGGFQGFRGFKPSGLNLVVPAAKQAKKQHSSVR